MIKKRRINLTEHKKETGDILRKHLIAKKPKAVVSLFNNSATKNYINKVNNFSVIGEGLNNDYVACEDIPWDESAGWRPTVELPKSIATKISKRIVHEISEEKLITSLRKEIEATLIDLRTYKKCQEFFPEATSFLPKEPQKANLPVNLDLLRKKLN